MRPICFFKTNQFKTKHHHVHFFFPFQPPIGSDSTSSIYFIIEHVSALPLHQSLQATAEWMTLQFL
jgi:hypothetical protein